MITYVIMGAIVLFLASLLLYKVEYTEDTAHFFNLQNTTAMRSFWCIVIILVHVPAAYQNRIQDMLGSFAYIGVTFFFMTSAYGLKVGKSGISHFWRRRLPKLLIPMLLVNVLGIVMHLIEGENVSALDLISINMWVVWLLACYFIYWAVKRLSSIGGGYRDLLVCLLIAAFSVVVYFNKANITVTTWCPEVFGFIWGILLADCKESFVKVVKKKWVAWSIITCLIAGVLGVAYLKFKPVPIFGDYLLKIVLGLAIILFMLAVNVKMSFGNKVGLFLGGISYEVYLLHGAVFGILACVAPDMVSGLFIGISIAITVMLSVAVNAVSEPIVNEINKALGKNN